MSRFRIIIAALAVAALAGCKTKQHTIKETTYTDTTRVTLDSTRATSESASTETTEVTRADSTFVRFVDGGGFVEIDSAGTMRFWGVAAVKRGIHSSAKATALRKDEKKAVQQVQREEARPQPKQRRTLLDKILISVGRAVCFAALAFLIYIYLKRKVR